jgi:hypothetical protein
MPEKIIFKVVLVSDKNGNGINYSNNYNKIIEYSGSKVSEII